MILSEMSDKVRSLNNFFAFDLNMQEELRFLSIMVYNHMSLLRNRCFTKAKNKHFYVTRCYLINVCIVPIENQLFLCKHMGLVTDKDQKHSCITHYFLFCVHCSNQNLIIFMQTHGS